jgi:hypothetical protein
MAVSFLNLVNDSGGNTDGTLIDKAQFQLLLMGAVVASTSTGAQNNWAPGLDGHTLIEWAGASDAAFTGLATGTAGQIAMIRNTGTKVGTFASLSGSSSAANQFTNSATSAPTPIAPGGWITYRHDGTNWKLVTHQQGALITPTYAAGTYTGSAGSWTVDAGDVGTYAYKLDGRRLTVWFQLSTTTVASAGAGLNIALPAGFVASAKTTILPFFYNDNGGTTTVGTSEVDPSTAIIRLLKVGFGNWAAATNTTAVFGLVDVEVT